MVSLDLRYSTMMNEYGQTDNLPEFTDVKAAAGRISAHIHLTPVLHSDSFDTRTGARVMFKCESFQRTGSFKVRGALNSVLARGPISPQSGVATHSSGNHGQALAWAGRFAGLPVHVVVPEHSNPMKVSAMRGYGANIYTCEEGARGREEGLRGVLAQTGATQIHPSNDFYVIAGQGTSALELFAHTPDLDLLFVPLGGGGLLSGSLLAMSGAAPRCRVIGVEPALADDGVRSLREGRILPSDYPPTIADGLKTALGSRTFPLIRRHVHELVTVTEAEIFQALVYTMERLKAVIEPSSA
ncbi:pyridoxal-phosphate dependent enzyme, partial [Myxococcota bacterium]|nr:pyridoxal-phosphate dependent enzyme [Myxococcota bacterium]